MILSYSYLQDKNFIKQINDNRVRELFARITVLNWDELPVCLIESKVSSGSINLSASSSVRRTATLNVVLDNTNYKLLLARNLLSINKKIALLIGIKNNTSLYTDYPIVWFPMGIFVIKTASISNSSNGLSASLQLSDKMCLLNGDIGGNIPNTVQFNKYNTLNAVGLEVVSYPTIYQIIRLLVNHWGGLNLSRIIVNDVDTKVKNVMRWNDPDTDVYIIHNINEDDSLDNSDGYGYSLVTVPTGTEYDGSGEVYGPYVYGQDLGFVYTYFIYQEDLISNPGDTVTSVLDKIKNTLGNYLYFYDVNGNFIFQLIKDYTTTSLATIKLNYMNNTSISDDPFNNAVNSLSYPIDVTSGKSVYDFTLANLISSFTNNPNYGNVKNDFYVWGKRKNGTSSSSASTPLRYHLSIAKRPQVKQELLADVVYYYDADDLLKIKVPVDLNLYSIKQGTFDVFYCHHDTDTASGSGYTDGYIYTWDSEEKKFIELTLPVILCELLPDELDAKTYVCYKLSLHKETADPLYYKISGLKYIIGTFYIWNSESNSWSQTNVTSINEIDGNITFYGAGQSSYYIYNGYSSDSKPTSPNYSITAITVDSTYGTTNYSGSNCVELTSPSTDVHTKNLYTQEYFDYGVDLDWYDIIVSGDPDSDTDCSIREVSLKVDDITDESLKQKAWQQYQDTYPLQSKVLYKVIYYSDKTLYYVFLNDEFIEVDGPRPATKHSIKVTDYRTKLYLLGARSEKNGIALNIYYELLKALWPKIFDVSKGAWIDDANKYSTTINYWLDLIDSSAAISLFSIDNIGRRTKILNDDKINCIFEYDVPDYIFVPYKDESLLDTLDNNSSESGDSTLSLLENDSYVLVENTPPSSSSSLESSSDNTGTSLDEGDTGGSTSGGLSGEELVVLPLPEEELVILPLPEEELIEGYSDLGQVVSLAANVLSSTSDTSEELLLQLLLEESDTVTTEELQIPMLGYDDIYYTKLLIISDCIKRRQKYIIITKSNYDKLIQGGSQNSAFCAIRNLLYQYTNYNESITIQTIPIYNLEPNTRITVHDDNTSIDGDYMISNMSVPLGPSGTMSITATKALTRF